MASRAFLSLIPDEAGCEQRYEVRLAATVSTTSDDLPVTLRELGTEGAVVEGLKLPRAGKDVLLGRGGREIFGAIVSSREARCEIVFEDTIDEAELLLWLRPLPEDCGPAPRPQLRRPGLRSRRPDPDEWKILHCWGNTSGLEAFED